MGVLEELTLKEKEAYTELKNRVADDMNTEMKNDVNLYLRFLRARDFNVDLAETMLKHHLVWRRTIQIDSLLTTYVPDEIVGKYMPLSRIGFDKDGALIRFFDFGSMDSKGMLKSTTKNAIVKTVVSYFEEDVIVLKKQTEKLKKPIQQWIYVLDFENYSFAKATHKPTLETLIALFMTYEANYPERLKAAYIVNTSIYFNILFQIIKPLLSGATLRKITIYGRDGWKRDLLKAIAPEVLPAFLGGERTDPDGNPLCNTTIKHGTLVPEELYASNSTHRLKGQPGVRKLTVSRMSKTNLELDVIEAGSNIEWEFQTECRDIGFGLIYKDSSKNSSKTVELIPKQRIDAHMNSEVGMFNCDKPGKYILAFDNSYSWIYQKEIYCRAEVVTPKEEKISSDD